MGNYNKGIETKQKFIMLAHKKLQEQSVTDLTVRDLSKECGYSPAALYRHFGSLEDLIAVSSVRFLETYIADYTMLVDENDNFLTIYLKGWTLFNHHAFERPDIYYGLFWGDYNGKFANAIVEYYELFPFPESRKAPSFIRRLFYNSNIYQRDYQILKEASNAGLISESDARFLSRTNPLIVKGILGESIGQNKEQRNQLEKECTNLIVENLARIQINEQ